MPTALATQTQEVRNQLTHDLQELSDKAAAEGRLFTTEEQAQWDTMWAQQCAAKDAVAAANAAEDRSRLMAEMQAAQDQVVQRQTAPDALEHRGGSDQRAAGADQVSFKLGRNNLRLERTGKTAQFYAALSPDYERAFNRFLTDSRPSYTEAETRAVAEVRALGTANQAGGGYWAPTRFMANLIQNMDNLVSIRQLATVWPVTQAGGLGFPTIESDPEDGDWTAEIVTVDEDTAMTTGLREFTPHLASKLLKSSIKLLLSSPIDVDAVVGERLAYKFAVTQEKAYLTGTGDDQPLGVFTASDQGVSTSRDVSTGATTTAIAASTLFATKYKVAQAQRAGASWIWHRDLLSQIAQLKGNDTYYWQPSLAADAPDRLLGMPVYESEYAPNTLSASQYVGILGNFRAGYYIADLMAMEVQRLNELYAINNQVGYVGRYFGDGMPVLEAAFARVQLAGS